MTSQPDYFKFLESAKLAEVSERLLREGYSVERDKKLDNVTFDLAASKNGQTIVYEFKSAGQQRFSREQLTQLQGAASRAGYIFRIVVAVPPPRVEVEIDRLEEQLLAHLIDQMPAELDSLSTHTAVEGVHDLSFETIRVTSGRTYVSGAGNVDVSLHYGTASDDGPSTNDAFPFSFSVILGSNGQLESLEELEVDTSEFTE